METVAFLEHDREPEQVETGISREFVNITPEPQTEEEQSS